MSNLLSTATPIITALVVIVALVGGIVVVTNPETLSFREYLHDLAPWVAGVAIGKGIAAHGK